MRKVIVLLSIMMIIAGVGCAALSEWATPADKDKAAIKYVTDSGVAEPQEYEGYFNLYKSRKLTKDVDTTYVLNKQELEQALAREDTQHNIHHGNAYANQRVSEQREEAIFGKEGLLTLSLSMLGMGGLGGFVGLMRKRPGDVTPAEMEQAITQATGKTSAALSVKEKQFVQLVKGIQDYIKIAPQASVDDLKAKLSKHQDADTQVAVAAAKVNGGIV